MNLRDRLRRAEPWLWAGAFAAILVALVLGAAQRVLQNVDSDVLVPWRLTADVIEHGTDVAWAVGGPTFVFPDFPLFVLARWIAPEMGAAYTVHAVLHFGLLALGAFLLVRACASERDGLDAAVGLAVAASYLGAVLIRRNEELLHLVFYPVAHEGTVAGGLLYIALAARVLRGGAGRGTLVLLAATAGLAVMSDALALSQFLLPGIVAAVVFARGRCGADEAGRVVTWTAAGVSGGLAAYIGLDATSFWQVTMSASSPAAQTVADSLKLFAGHLPSLFEAADAVAPLLAAAVLAWAARRHERHGAASVAAVVLRTLAVVGVLSLCVPSLGGRWGETKAVRYMLPVWIVPVLAAAVAVAGASRGRGARRVFLGACLAACGGIAAARGALAVPATPYPDVVREIDAAASAHGVTEGVGTYWYASLTTALTRRGLRLSPVHPDGIPEMWLTNADWFFAGAPHAPRWPEHRVIVIADAEHDLIRRRFGEPAVVVPLAGCFDHKGAPIEVWMRPPPGPPFDSGWMQDEVLGATIAIGLRSIDPRRTTTGR